MIDIFKKLKDCILDENIELLEKIIIISNDFKRYSF